MFYYLTKFHWLPLLLEILDTMWITIVCQPGCGVIKFEINLAFLIKLLCYMTKKSRQKLKYLENEKSFWAEIKSIFPHLSRVSIAKNCLRPKSAPLISLQLDILDIGNWICYQVKLRNLKKDVKTIVRQVDPVANADWFS